MSSPRGIRSLGTWKQMFLLIVKLTFTVGVFFVLTTHVSDQAALSKRNEALRRQNLFEEIHRAQSWSKDQRKNLGVDSGVEKFTVRSEEDDDTQNDDKVDEKDDETPSKEEDEGQEDNTPSEGDNNTRDDDTQKDKTPSEDNDDTQSDDTRSEKDSHTQRDKTPSDDDEDDDTRRDERQSEDDGDREGAGNTHEHDDDTHDHDTQRDRKPSENDDESRNDDTHRERNPSKEDDDTQRDNTQSEEDDNTRDDKNEYRQDDNKHGDMNHAEPKEDLQDFATQLRIRSEVDHTSSLRRKQENRKYVPSSFTMTQYHPVNTRQLTHAQLQQPLTLFNGRQGSRPFPDWAKLADWESSPLNADSTTIDGRRGSRLAYASAPPGQDKKSLNNRTKTFAVIFPCDNGVLNCYHRPEYPTDHCMNKCTQIYNVMQADVVVFQVFRMIKQEIVPTFKRPPGQIWAMFDIEPACRKGGHKMLEFPELKGTFNWTISYRLDADIPWVYGYLRKIRDPPHKDYSAIFRRKSVTAAWFVGHCNTWSGRDEYARLMQTYGHLDLHIYGKCGNYSCGYDCTQGSCPRSQLKRGADKSKCFPLLSEKYFFYLAFENSLCKDYVTEKFFKIFEDVDTIPVVRGGADYKKLFPANTFVDASDFESPADLSAYLKELSRNQTAYTNMLKEKNRYQYVSDRKWYCKMCDKMHEVSDRIQWYPNMKKWYVEDQCKEPDDLVAPPIDSMPSVVERVVLEEGGGRRRRRRRRDI